MYRLLIVGVVVGCGSDAPPPQTPAPTQPPLSKDAHPNVAPSRLEELRIAGDKTITPPDDV
ncbi:MAG TPA: hypothetical protein VF403_11235, partial [Kofleriaceae bacterium]